ncbi:MAG TPA: hypothetical protein VM261_09105 [Kofleriaceae bacterium]|nr:hypothetical protein [Kofleriaceae bacterium]
MGMRTVIAVVGLAAACLNQPRATAEDATAIPLAEQTMARGDAATPAGGKLVELLSTVRTELRATKYQARTDVRLRDGYYAWDCSGMAAWVLQRSAPKARKAVVATGGGRGSRPVARDFFHTIAKAPTDRARKGWQRIHVSDVQAGDTFAWLKSPISTSKITGHVGFAVGPAHEVPGWPGAYAIRIVDSTRLPHQDDTREMNGDGGYGFGTMVFVTGDDGEVKAYAWFGTEYLPRTRAQRMRVGDNHDVVGTIDDLPSELWPWLGFMPARVVFGRPSA